MLDCSPGNRVASWQWANWPLRCVRAGVSLRTGGVSGPPYQSLNIGGHVGDDAEAVAENRRRLERISACPSPPRWLQQVHGNDIADMDASKVRLPVADAAFSRTSGVTLALMTADCLPLVMAAEDGSWLGVAHCGWRSLAGQIVRRLIETYGGTQPLYAWFGPGIGPAEFEVGQDLVDIFLMLDAASHACFTSYPGRPGGGIKYRADLAALCRLQFAGAKVYSFGGDFCTMADEQRFFSYRRDGITGRHATLAWIT